MVSGLMGQTKSPVEVLTVTVCGGAAEDATPEGLYVKLSFKSKLLGSGPLETVINAFELSCYALFPPWVKGGKRATYMTSDR